MPRKRQTSPKEVTPALLKFREKRKWQINFRRYVVEQSTCSYYAPYFGLDIKKIRQWFEYQLTDDLNWKNFGKKWQFEHIVPVSCFEFDSENELKMCWNFINIRVEKLQPKKDMGVSLDILKAKNYFHDLYQKTTYTPCLYLLNKINEIEVSGFANTDVQQLFISENQEYLEKIKDFSVFEFELLNSGRNIEEVKTEVDFLKNMGKHS